VPWSTKRGLLLCWLALTAAGISKGYQMGVGQLTFDAAMASVRGDLYSVAAAGIVVAASLLSLAVLLLRAKVIEVPTAALHRDALRV